MRISRPRIHGESLLLADAFDVFAVEDFEFEPEAGIEFGFPLVEHGGRAGNDDVLDALAQKKLRGDEPGFDGFPKADIVCDEEIHPRQPEGFVEWIELVSVELDTSAEGRLEEIRVRGGDTLPAEGVVERSEVFAGVEVAASVFLSDGLPRLIGEDLGVEFRLPKDG